MKKLLDNNPVASIIAVIVTIVGGVVCIVEPSSIGTFKQYAVAVGISCAGLGVLGIARSQGGKG
jgi:hypothetical protein